MEQVCEVMKPFSNATLWECPCKGCYLLRAVWYQGEVGEGDLMPVPETLTVELTLDELTALILIAEDSADSVLASAGQKLADIVWLAGA